MIKMKALRSFGTTKAAEGKVRRGREFTAQSDRRADELERAGLAYRIDTKMQPRHANKMEQPPENKAAERGPLDSHGGMTGAEYLAPSSRPDLPQPKRPGRPRLNRSKDESES